jgi:hypothetical protein
MTDIVERLRDTFAAAALTGLLSNVQRYQNGPLTEQAFEIADFMLRERSRTGQDAGDTTPQSRSETNHDAVPAARAYADGEPAPKRGGEDGLNPRDGTGNTPTEAEIDALEYVLRGLLERLRREKELP